MVTVPSETQTVATLGIFNTKSESDEEKVIVKHSMPVSTTESDSTDTETHCDLLVSDMMTDPLIAS